jgi:trehalose 6-phosphate synthase/phosphatase
MTELIEKYRKAINRLILLDYDGTLVSYFPEPGAALLPDHISHLLTNLLKTPKNEVYIITGRSNTEIDRVLNNLPINIIAEHGAVMRINGAWKDCVSGTRQWKKSIMPLFNQATRKCPGSFVEEKRFSLAWHYRNADPELGHAIAEELMESVSQLDHSAHLKTLDGNKVIEILNVAAGKGIAVKEILENKNFDFVLSVGDDATDEEMFEVLSDIQNAFTIKIGTGETHARYKFEDISEVERLLQNLIE